MDKSPEAFRTISEVAEALETPAHVLRFWESRFPQIRPVKRAGGRRYYRPADVALLTGIKRLLHDEGMTIRGVQKILREQGIRHVSGLTDEPSPEETALDAAMVARFDHEPATPPDAAEAETASALEAALQVGTAPEAEAEEEPAPQAPAQAAMDWLASLPATDTAAPSRPTEIASAAAQPELPLAAPETAPAADPGKGSGPALSVRSVTVRQPAPPAEELRASEEPGPTLAARLRALPRGSLSGHREDLAEIAARIASLRDRLSGHPGR